MKIFDKIAILKNLRQNLKERMPKEKISIGLDIGASSVKLVKLKFLKESIELVGFSVEPMQVDVVSVIKKIAQAHSINKVNISVSGPAALIRYISFPKMQKQELSQSLRFEAQKHIPFAVNEVNIDGHILNDDLPDNKMMVLVAAAKQDIVQQRLKIAEEAGLKVRAVDLDSVALINAFIFNYAEYSEDQNLKNKTIALLNIGTVFSSVNILENAIPRLSRDMQIAGNHFTQKIADTFGIDFKEAEQLKCNPGKEREAKVAACVETVLSNVAKEVRVSFDYYESQGASTVEKIFLSGAASRLIGLKESLESLLSISVEYWDPLRKIIIADSVDSEKVKQLSSQLAVAVGLALRG